MLQMVVGCSSKCQLLRLARQLFYFWLREAPESKPYLDGVDSRIRRGEAGIGDMHEAHFRAPVVFAAQKMQSESARSRKVHPRGSRRHLGIAEKHAPSELRIGRQAAPPRKIPFQSNRIQSKSISRAGRLRQQKYRHNVHRILKSSPQRTMPHRIGE